MSIRATPSITGASVPEGTLGNLKSDDSARPVVRPEAQPAPAGTDAVILSSAARELSAKLAGDAEPELQLSPAKLRAMVDPGGRPAVPAGPLKPGQKPVDSSHNREDRHVD